MITGGNDFADVLNRAMLIHKKIDRFDQSIADIGQDIQKIINKQYSLIAVRGNLNRGGIEIHYPDLELLRALENAFDGYCKIGKLLLNRKKELINEYDLLATELSRYICEKPEILNELNDRQFIFLQEN